MQCSSRMRNVFDSKTLLRVIICLMVIGVQDQQVSRDRENRTRHPYTHPNVFVAHSAHTKSQGKKTKSRKMNVKNIKRKIKIYVNQHFDTNFFSSGSLRSAGMAWCNNCRYSMLDIYSIQAKITHHHRNKEESISLSSPITIILWERKKNESRRKFQFLTLHTNVAWIRFWEIFLWQSNLRAPNLSVDS